MDGPIRIDLRAILRGRLKGKAGKMIPGFLIGVLERIICQDRLNELLEKAWPAEGSFFSDAILRELGIKLEVRGMERIPKGKRLLFASNHPLGGLDGIALIKVLGEMYGDDNVRFLVNDMLMHVEPLRNVFLPINKYGSQGREAAKVINATYASGRQMLVFPAGLVSRLHDDGGVRDLDWQKAFVAKAMEYDRTIVPVRFEASNSRFFYRFARWRKKSGLKVNLEQALLPSELCKASGRTFVITFLDPVSPEELRATGLKASQLASRLREKVCGR